MKIVPILHNIRSLHNVGAIIRTAEGLGVSEIWLSGYTPYPEISDDTRLPHVRARANNQIAKTALGAEKYITFKVFEETSSLLKAVKESKIHLIAIEQSKNSRTLSELKVNKPMGIIFGNETKGIEEELLQQCEEIFEIPMKGKKESFNVSATAAMVLYTALNTID